MKNLHPLFKPTVSVIVPVHKDGDAFRRCILHLSQAIPQPEEILIISDGAGESIDRLEQETGFRCLKNPSGNGPARARNYGASCATGDLLYFVDSDVIIQADSIGRLREAFTENASLAALIGSYDDAPAEPNFLSQYKNLIHHYVHQHSNEETSTFWGACGAIRREVFLELGGFDENYRRPCIEDIEFGYRLKSRGYKIHLLKTLQCKHLKKWGVLSLLKTDLLDRAIPWTELILRDWTLINDLNLRPLNRISVILVFLFFGLLAGGLWNPALSWISPLFLAAVLALNIPVYRFFFSKRKLLFTLKAIPWHIIYYICCGLGFAAGTLRGLFKKAKSLFEKDAMGKRAVLPRKSIQRP
jgi:GT2 family glycosyltransferase